ncbi:hypothetical protein [Bradyrhizobium sp. RD5-C2]|uniref:phage tail assembly chaperone n=1 Tax=Bradyrhizobium sp. RD5-C2 TaxID=244562 RepID=UPI001CC6D532|nr:hypothetical protein [Bradyrhizobium sp. RD5-C2]GIQ73187.1 hypothetical protein BraRD5C2_16250 [Bradyrhizobium sp. RD5-C2]
MQAATAAGVPLQTLPCVASRVDLFGHLWFEADAFRRLSTDRPIGFDRGPIPWRSIHLYAERYGLVQDDFDRFAEIIHAMDAAYLDYHRKLKPNGGN